MVDSNGEEVLPRVISWRVTAVLNSGGSSTTGKVSLDAGGGELSSATSYGERRANSPASIVDKPSSKEAGLPTEESRRLGEYLHGPQPTTIYKHRTRANERRRLEYANMGLMSSKR